MNLNLFLSTKLWTLNMFDFVSFNYIFKKEFVKLCLSKSFRICVCLSNEHWICLILYILFGLKNLCIFESSWVGLFVFKFVFKSIWICLKVWRSLYVLNVPYLKWMSNIYPNSTIQFRIWAYVSYVHCMSIVYVCIVCFNSCCEQSPNNEKWFSLIKSKRFLNTNGSIVYR